MVPLIQSFGDNSKTEHCGREHTLEGNSYSIRPWVCQPSDAVPAPLWPSLGVWESVNTSWRVHLTVSTVHHQWLTYRWVLPWNASRRCRTPSLSSAPHQSWVSLWLTLGQSGYSEENAVKRKLLQFKYYFFIKCLTFLILIATLSSFKAHEGGDFLLYVLLSLAKQ